MSNILFRSTGDKSNEQNNTIEESNSNEVEETVTQSPLVIQSDDVDAQRKIFCFINFTLKEEIIAGKKFVEFIAENSTLNVIAIPCKSNSAVSMIKLRYFYNTNFYKDSPSANCSLWVDRIILYLIILYYIYK